MLWTGLALALVAASPQPGTFRIDEVARGRFGAGKEITANTASQDLTVWSVLNDGKGLEIRRYDRDARAVSLGSVVLPGTVQNEVRDIGWTQLTSRYTSEAGTMDALESLLTPVLWFRLAAKSVQVHKGAEVVAAWIPTRSGWVNAALQGYDAAKAGAPSEPFMVVVTKDRVGLHASLWIWHRAPTSVRKTEGLSLSWDGQPVRFGALPVFGAVVDPSKSIEAWVQEAPASEIGRFQRLARLYWHVPSRLEETYQLTDKKISLTNRIVFLPSAKDAWGYSVQAKPFAAVPPGVAAAKTLDYPVSFAKQPVAVGLRGYLADWMIVPGTDKLVYDVDKPDLYGMLLSPVWSDRTGISWPEAIRETIPEYRAYVREAYAGEPRSVFGTSAIGEGRWMTGEYPLVGLMGTEERNQFDGWADWAIRESIGNREKCYAWCTDPSTPLRFLLDNYRIAGNDYVDAGWFGYNVTAMWSHAHYGNRWDEVWGYWPLMRDLFYGWNWIYGDYATLYAPLYVEGKGGNPKGFTDNQAMLQAAYAWARMADQFGDAQTLKDALYMLTRERMGRYARMNAYRQSRSLGYSTLDSALVSDQGPGPSMSLANDLVNPKPEGGNAILADYGGSIHALWFLVGSFLEPPSLETLDMLRVPKARQLVARDLAMLEGWLPRWFAAPGSGETTNYQIFLRSLLLDADPEWVRAVADWQSSVGDGAWTSSAFHGYAVMGLALSPFRWAESRSKLVYDTQKGTIECAILDDAEGQRLLWVLSRKTQPETITVGLGERFASLFTLDGKTVVKAKDGNVALRVNPGVNVWTWGLSTIGSEVYVPRVARGLIGGSAPIDVAVRGLGKASDAKVTLQGRTMDLLSEDGVDVSVPMDARMPFDVDVTVNVDGQVFKRKTTVFPVPATTARLSVSGSPTVVNDRLATATVRAVNRLLSPATLEVRWEGPVAGSKSFDLAPGKTEDIEVPIQSNWPAGEHRLVVSTVLDGKPFMSVSRRVLVMRDVQPGSTVLAFGFEGEKDRWNVPNWSDANQDANGKPRQPYLAEGLAFQGKSALAMDVDVKDGTFSQAFFMTPAGEDWSKLAKLRARMWLPADAAEGLMGRVQMTGSDWKYREFDVEHPLKPGEWNLIEADLTDEGAPKWNCTAGELRSALTHVLNFGFKIHNEPSDKGFKGRVLLDAVEFVLR